MATVDNVFTIQDDQEFDVVLEAVSRAGNPVVFTGQATLTSSMTDILTVIPQADGKTFTVSSTGKVTDTDTPVQLSATIPADPAVPGSTALTGTLLVKVVIDVAAGIRLAPANVRERDLTPTP
jgi:hypothetical protein